MAVPLGFVALTWIRLFRPLLAAELPQSPSNVGLRNLGFVKDPYRGLGSVPYRDLRVGMSLRIDIVPNRTAKPQILLRKSWRERKRVRHKTVGNLTGLPPEMVESFRTILRGGIALGSIDDALGWKRALPHGHVAAALATARKLGLPRAGTMWRLTTLRALGSVADRNQEDTRSRRKPQLSPPDSVWRSGNKTITGGATLSPKARPGARLSAQPAGGAPSPSGRERTPMG